MCTQQRLRSVCCLPEDIWDPWLSTECPMKTLIRLCRCTDWSAYSLGTHAVLKEMLWPHSYARSVLVGPCRQTGRYYQFCWTLIMSCLCKQCRSRSVGFFKIQLIWICTVCHMWIYINNLDQVIWLAEN